MTFSRGVVMTTRDNVSTNIGFNWLLEAFSANRKIEGNSADRMKLVGYFTTICVKW